MNRRVSDAGTRGTDGVSIRTINFGTVAAAPVDPALPAPAATVIPADVVLLGTTYSDQNPSCDASLSTEQCLQKVADHSVVVLPASPPVTYTSSNRTSVDVAVRIDQTSGSAASNTVVIDGLMLTPNASVVLDGGVNDEYPACRCQAGSSRTACS